MVIMASESGGVSIEVECKFGVKIKECSLGSIISAFMRFLPDLLADFVMKILLGYAEYVMSLAEKPFCCETCGNSRNFTWKTRHGKTIRILTIFQWLSLNQLQVKCSDCGHKFYIPRKLLMLEPMKRIPEDTRKSLVLLELFAVFELPKRS